MNRSSKPSKPKPQPVSKAGLAGDIRRSILLGLASLLFAISVQHPALALETTFGSLNQVDDAARQWWDKDQEARAAMKDNDLEQARVLFDEAIRIAERNNNIEPGLANSLRGLALLEHRKGHAQESERLYELSMQYEEALVGRSSLRFADCLPDLAWLYHWHGKDDKAEVLYHKTVSNIEKNLPADDPKLLPVLYHYRAFLKECDRVAEAEKIGLEIARIEAKTRNQLR